jgi:hypothetical protein
MNGTEEEQGKCASYKRLGPLVLKNVVGSAYFGKAVLFERRESERKSCKLR